MEHSEALLGFSVQVLRLVVEVAGAVVIGIGCVVAIAELVRRRLLRQPAGFVSVRLGLARYLALGLEFQLAADILVPAIAPSWDEIGKLAASAAIRTALNFALAHEMKEEQAELAEGL